MAKKPIVSVTYENERISIKNSLYLKCVLRLSCVVHGPIYGRFMGFYVNGFLSIYKGLPRFLVNIYIAFSFNFQIAHMRIFSSEHFKNSLLLYCMDSLIGKKVNSQFA